MQTPSLHAIELGHAALAQTAQPSASTSQFCRLAPKHWVVPMLQAAVQVRQPPAQASQRRPLPQRAGALQRLQPELSLLQTWINVPKQRTAPGGAQLSSHFCVGAETVPTVHPSAPSAINARAHPDAVCRVLSISRLTQSSASVDGRTIYVRERRRI